MGIYFDNAATSFPKPASVYQAVDHTLRNIGGSPGRGSHKKALEASRILFNTREKLAQLLNITDSSQIVFTLNATEALNLALKGLLKEGDHVVTTSMEHNSVLRPLKVLEQNKGILKTIVPCSAEGLLDLADLRKALRPNTRLVVVTHASNVLGTLMPIAEIRSIIERFLAQSNKDIFLVLDAAQTVGSIPINVQELGVDLLAASGHKGLLGPQGTGFLYIRKGVNLEPLIEGGTGSFSHQEEQPQELPDRYESGTQNTPGLAGLGAAVDFLLREGGEKVWQHKKRLTELALEGLQEIPGIQLYGPRDPEKQVAVISFNLSGFDPTRLSMLLDEEFDIQTRAGLHCAPLAHQTIGSFPQGTVRISFGYFNKSPEITYLIKALKKLKTKIL
jgi:cysteine desulfurase family protein